MVPPVRIDGLTVPPGLAGDGRRDDADAINYALQLYGRVRLPAATYLVASPVMVPSGGWLTGSTDGETRIVAADNFGDRPVVRNRNFDPKGFLSRDREIRLANLVVNGNGAANASATEHAHGVSLRAVDGARFEKVTVISPKGDGVYVSGALSKRELCSSNIVGDITVRRADRQGVTLICAEDVDLVVDSSRCKYFAVDMEPNHADEFVRRVRFSVRSDMDGSGTLASGGVGLSNNRPGAKLSDIALELAVAKPNGNGVVWRNVRGLTIKGRIEAPRFNGLFSIDGGDFASSATLDVTVISPGESGLKAADRHGGELDGVVRVSDAVAASVNLSGARGGALTILAAGGRKEGVVLDDVTGMTFPSSSVTRHQGHGLWLRNGSSGNRFPYLQSAASATGFAIREEAGCDDNVATHATLGGDPSRRLFLSGRRSSATR